MHGKKKSFLCFLKTSSVLLLTDFLLLSQTSVLAAVVGDGSINSTVKINKDTSNGPTLSADDYYAISITSIGDLNGDGVQDLAVGAYADDNGGTDRGAVHLHFMNTDGSIDSTVELNDGTSNGAVLANEDYYGVSVASIGDLDGDGVQDLAVGADGDDAGGTGRGALHIHFMNTDGSIDSTIEINDTTTNGPTLSDEDYYGFDITSIGDLNEDGVQDLVVSAPEDDGSGTIQGAVHIHFMNTDGSVDSTVEINGSTTNGPSLSDYDYYGLSVDSPGDLNGDSIPDLVVGAPCTTSSGQGAVYIHFMNTDGSIKSTVAIDNDTSHGPSLYTGDVYGFGIDSIGDLNGDGVEDLAIGAPGDDTGGTNRGTVHIHFMNTDGSIDSTVELNSNTTNGGTLGNSAFYGSSIANIGDLDGNGVNDLAIGIDEDGSYHGAVFIHFMHRLPTQGKKFSKDTRCLYTTPPEITWIKLTPTTQNDIAGMLVTWTQYDANKVTIRIDNGTDSYPYKVNKTENDGHEFLPNVFPYQKIKIKPVNHCKDGNYSIPVSYALHPDGWYNVP